VLDVLDEDQAAGLAAVGITVETVQAQVGALAEPGNTALSGHIPFSTQAKKILELSMREALQRHSSSISTAHILLAVIREGNGLGAQILTEIGGPPTLLRQLIIESAAGDGTDGAEMGDPLYVGPGPSYRQLGPEQPSAVIRFHQELSSIDQRLANIGRHLGVPAQEPISGGFRKLLDSVRQHLASIEQHLGITSDAAPGEAGDAEPAEPDEEPPGAATGK